ncbi:transcriptional regulator with XRE-family HTH domain [Hymenobacter sp. UYAg731]
MTELPYAPDERLTTTRAHFGLSQREAAHLLGTTQTRINHAETGRRPLPYAAGQRLRALHALVRAAPAGPPAPGPDEADDLGLAIGRLADCRYAAARLAYRLAQVLPARAAPARQRLAAAVAVPAALALAPGADPLPPQRLGAQQAQWALLLSQARQELLGTSGRAATLLAQARLAGLRAEAAVLAAALEAGAENLEGEIQ